MAWSILGSELVGQRIDEVSSTQKEELGKVIRAKDPTYGAGMFRYMKGATSTVVGSWVTFNSDDWTTTLLAPNAIGPVAIAMGVIDANTKYGWYQVDGKALGMSAVVSDNGKVYIDTVPGYCDDAVVAGDKVFNAKWAAAATAAGTLTEVEISFPFTTDEST